VCKNSEFFVERDRTSSQSKRERERTMDFFHSRRSLIYSGQVHKNTLLSKSHVLATRKACALHPDRRSQRRHHTAGRYAVRLSYSYISTICSLPYSLVKKDMYACFASHQFWLLLDIFVCLSFQHALHVRYQVALGYPK
jgi:hypothetical protein